MRLHRHLLACVCPAVLAIAWSLLAGLAIPSAPAAVSAAARPANAPNTARHLLYVATPGIRNYVEYGGVGLLVFDMDNGHKFLRRIPTFEVPESFA